MTSFCLLILYMLTNNFFLIFVTKKLGLDPDSEKFLDQDADPNKGARSLQDWSLLLKL
jgi:hypothetical protein